MTYYRPHIENDPTTVRLLVNSSVPVQDAIQDALIVANTLSKRGELTETEQALVKAADKILTDVMLRVGRRFAMAEPGTTTVSVLGQ
jgi:hypothetical protein